MNTKKFIKTFDSQVAELLLSQGFTKVSFSNGIYVFLNDNKLNFSLNDVKGKFIYTNLFEL